MHSIKPSQIVLEFNVCETECSREGTHVRPNTAPAHLADLVVLGFSSPCHLKLPVPVVTIPRGAEIDAHGAGHVVAVREGQLGENETGGGAGCRCAGGVGGGTLTAIPSFQPPGGQKEGRAAGVPRGDAHHFFVSCWGGGGYNRLGRQFSDSTTSLHGEEYTTWVIQQQTLAFQTPLSCYCGQQMHCPL